MHAHSLNVLLLVRLGDWNVGPARLQLMRLDLAKDVVTCCEVQIHFHLIEIGLSAMRASGQADKGGGKAERSRLR